MKKVIIVFSLLFVPLLASASFGANLYYGLQNNNSVKEMQEFLTDQGVYSGLITGNFYSLTLKAVKDFQKKEKVSPTSGFFGPLTRKKANDILAKNVESSNQQAIQETGSIPPPAEPAKTTNDVVKSLQDQIALLLQQLSLLQSQNNIVQKQSETINKIQENTQQIVQNTTPTPQANAPVQSAPNPYDISIQNQLCNLKNNNPKTEYGLDELLSGGNTDGRIFMNAFILNKEGQNYYSTNPPATMIITTSDHSNDKTLKGSGNTGPCGYYYPYEFYATKTGTYTITYNIVELNLSKTITINITSDVEKPIISSSGITVSTTQKETDYPLSELDNISDTSNVKYWLQSSKPTYRYSISAWCSDADTPFSKIDMVSHLENGLYYYRGWFGYFGNTQFSGTTTCKFIHSSPMNSSESDTTIFSIK